MVAQQQRQTLFSVNRIFITQMTLSPTATSHVIPNLQSFTLYSIRAYSFITDVDGRRETSIVFSSSSMTLPGGKNE